ncbi:FAD-dependent oxidoreductase [Roseibium sp.]|uniref:FAD-dependent oxidoreductase n=1 Tax=Roseibium sp. TaxID=1936156 RepID=UPI003A97EA80
MFSLIECDNYHDREAPEGGELHDYLRRRITDFGWLIGRPEAYCAEDAAWIRESMAIPVWMAEHYNDDIFAISHESLDYWRNLMDSTPELFAGVEFLEPLLRVASTADYNAKQLKRQKRVGAYRNDLEPGGVAEHYPALAAGVRNREIAGGIEVTGFTVNVHDYVVRLVNLLERRGVRFRWGTRATRIVRTNSIVTEVEIDGRVEGRNHYFLSLGVYGADLLRGTATQCKVHGVLGAWMTIPNLGPGLNVALKIARIGHIACSGNIIPARDAQGRPILIFGAGDGYGEHPTQSLGDVLHLFKHFGRLDGLCIGIIGHLGWRAHRSLVIALSLFDVHLAVLEPPGSTPPDDVQALLSERGTRVTHCSDVGQVLQLADAVTTLGVYHSNFHADFDDKINASSRQGQPTPDAYRITAAAITGLGRHVPVLHIGPISDHVDRAMDAMPQAHYFQQARDGVWMRAALLALLLRQQQ